MPFPFRTTVYVHGAGQQEHPILLKRRLDGIVFGGPQGDKTRLGYYSDILHGPSAPPDELEAVRLDPVAVAANPAATRAELVDAIVGGPTGLEAVDRKAALVDALFERADEVAAAEATAASGGLEGVRFPDLGFRVVVGLLAKDVIRYLFDGDGPAVREAVRAPFRGATEPILVIAHSLGTIVTYDVLSEAEFKGLDIGLVTLGSPLGIENVQDELRGRAGQPNPIPDPVRRWSNLADPGDPVASDQPLAPEFTRNAHQFDIVDDLTVNNRGFLNHELTGYLVIKAVRRAIGVR